ncbi:hypothetical protein SAMN06295967_109171 [Belliella buryatensis]|uniref:6-bladed beta-propeller protein n=1 Tax=Belliella buryatensis TaxID=1500549 RepID=A0A239EIR8_9BACT|nr:hypothetical protein [Belliella buryatensis]SNS44459.1 hypothetical protein SAMN06295967_109171 [Belliella buryatensis]
MKYYHALLLFVFISCKHNENNFNSFIFELKGKITLNNELYAIDFTDFSKINDSLIYGYDMSKGVVFKFDNHGNLLQTNRFQNGENEVDLSQIGHLYPISNDSILILENGYGNLLLLDGNLKIKNSWNIRTLTQANVSTTGSRSQILNFRLVDSDPYITVAANDSNLQLSDISYFEKTFLAAKINLNTGDYKPLFKYPNESTYRQVFLWGNEVPYFIYHNDKYILSFPMDPNIYIFTEDSEDYKVVPYTGKLNKDAYGVEFGMYQGDFFSQHFIDVNYNKNDFNLVSKNLLTKSGKEYFVRVSRKAINDKNLNIKDLNTFVITSPKQDYIIQIVELNEKENYEWKEFLLPSDYKNFVHIDENGNLYLKRSDEKKEVYTIDLVSWDFAGF